MAGGPDVLHGHHVRRLHHVRCPSLRLLHWRARRTVQTPRVLHLPQPGNHPNLFQSVP